MAYASVQETEYVSNLVNTTPILDMAPNSATSYGAKQDEPEWIKLYSRDKAFAAFVNDLLSLRDEEDEIPPSSDVIDWILESSVLAKKLLAQRWESPRITSDDHGGVRLSWRKGNRELRAVVPANLSARYLYWQEGSEYGGFPNFGSATLYSGLSRMNE